MDWYHQLNTNSSKSASAETALVFPEKLHAVLFHSKHKHFAAYTTGRDIQSFFNDLSHSVPSFLPQNSIQLVQNYLWKSRSSLLLVQRVLNGFQNNGLFSLYFQRPNLIQFVKDCAKTLKLSRLERKVKDVCNVEVTDLKHLLYQKQQELACANDESLRNRIFADDLWEKKMMKMILNEILYSMSQ